MPNVLSAFLGEDHVRPIIRLSSMALALAGVGLSGAARAETLRISGVYPAASDGAAALNTLSVEKFSGTDGPALSFRVADALREAQIDGEPYFTVLVEQLAGEADAVLTGHAEPRFSEQEYRGEREVCWTEDDRGRCTERREVELDCIRVTMTLRPEMRLVGYNGNVLWSSSIERSHQESFCPVLDSPPSADEPIARMVGEIADEIRYELAPSYRAQDIRIMERRRGLEGDARSEFRDAIRLTKTDEAAACAEFERLHAANPNHPSLSFNVGLCAEQRYDVDAAEAAYTFALQFEDSDDEAQAGLRRLEARMRADMQLANHYGH